jgi:hypothetical protein
VVWQARHVATSLRWADWWLDWVQLIFETFETFDIFDGTLVGTSSKCFHEISFISWEVGGKL